MLWHNSQLQPISIKREKNVDASVSGDDVTDDCSPPLLLCPCCPCRVHTLADLEFHAQFHANNTEVSINAECESCNKLMVVSSVEVSDYCVYTPFSIYNRFFADFV